MTPPPDIRIVHEVKFLLDAEASAQICTWARAHLLPDPHGAGRFDDQYAITSLYFDTAARDVFNKRGSYGRSKYRIRRYGEAPRVFLERKLRTTARLAKRRTLVSIDDIQVLESSLADVPATSSWFHRRLNARRLAPVCQVSYRRTARVGHTPEGPVRLTMDDDLSATRVDGIGFVPGGGVSLMPGATIMELKYGPQLPALFKQLIEEFGVSARSASKYRRAAEALGVAGDGVPTGCAHRA